MLKHRSLAVIVWAGSDSLYCLRPENDQFVKAIKRADHMRHIAISKYISDDLNQLGIKHELLPVTQVTHQMFHPKPLGTKVFFYDSHTKSAFYGTPTVRKILNEFPDLNYLTGFSHGQGHVPYTEMPKVYEECFLGLRLTPHDGLPNTVIELGLMGRKCVCNHSIPNCIPWKNEQDVIDAIVSERKRIGQTDEKTANAVRDYINIGEQWLDTDYYESFPH
jgi:hypothetical protein